MCLPLAIKCTACLGFSHPAHIQLEVPELRPTVLSCKAYEASASPGARQRVKKDQVSLFSKFGIKRPDPNAEVGKGQWGKSPRRKSKWRFE